MFSAKLSVLSFCSEMVTKKLFLFCLFKITFISCSGYKKGRWIQKCNKKKTLALCERSNVFLSCLRWIFYFIFNHLSMRRYWEECVPTKKVQNVQFKEIDRSSTKKPINMRTMFGIVHNSVVQKLRSISIGPLKTEAARIIDFWCSKIIRRIDCGQQCTSMEIMTHLLHPI